MGYPKGTRGFLSCLSNTHLLLCTLSFCLPRADPSGFHSELQRLATCFFKPEAISWKEALSLAKRPRGGKGAAAFIRKRPASTLASGPAAKRPKTASSTTGRLTYFSLLLYVCTYLHSLGPRLSFLIQGPDSQVCHPKEAPSPWALPALKGSVKRDIIRISDTPGLWERRKINKNSLPQVSGGHLS
jgi:hypothetical protein